MNHINFQRGWHHALLAQCGAITPCLYTTLTRNSYKPHQTMIQNNLTCLPESNKPHRWYQKKRRDLSFVSQEKWAWLQIALSVYLRYMATHDAKLFDGASLSYTFAKFPAVGFIKDHLAVFFCDVYPKQSFRDFQEHLKWHQGLLAKDNLMGKWAIPFSNIMVRKPFFFGRDTVAVDNLDRLLDGRSELVALDVQDLYQNVLITEKR